MYKETRRQFKCISNFTQLKISEIEVGIKKSHDLFGKEKRREDQ